MSDAETTTENTPTEAPQQRKGPPAWGVVVFLAVLAGLLLMNQLMRTSGQPIEWIDGDLDAAFRQSKDGLKRVFLYIYEDDDVHARNEQSVFTQVWARGPLAKVPCVRVPVESNRLLATKYRYGGTPLFLLLDETGHDMGRCDGVAVDRLQFETYIGRPIVKHASQLKQPEAQ